MEIELHDLFWTMDTQEIKDMGSVLWVVGGGCSREVFTARHLGFCAIRIGFAYSKKEWSRYFLQTLLKSSDLITTVENYLKNWVCKVKEPRVLGFQTPEASAVAFSSDAAPHVSPHLRPCPGCQGLWISEIMEKARSLSPSRFPA